MTISLPKVDFVSITLPQLQVALIRPYPGWISAFMMTPFILIPNQYQNFKLRNSSGHA